MSKKITEEYITLRREEGMWIIVTFLAVVTAVTLSILSLGAVQEHIIKSEVWEATEIPGQWVYHIDNNLAELFLVSTPYLLGLFLTVAVSIYASRKIKSGFDDNSAFLIWGQATITLIILAIVALFTAAPTYNVVDSIISYISEEAGFEQYSGALNKGKDTLTVEGDGNAYLFDYSKVPADNGNLAIYVSLRK